MQIQYLINGRHEACLTPFDRGFAYGDGVFRTFAVKHGVAHCWQRHYRRLSDDCSALGIVCPSSPVLLTDIAHLCAAQESVVLKIIVTRGEGGRGYAVPPLATANRALVMSPLPHYPEQNFDHGVRLQLCQLRLGLQPRLAGIKHLNRLENVLARMEWVDQEIADGLLLDSAGRVIECTMSNLFMRRGETLITPRLDRCGVAGVTRQRIIDFASELGFRVEIEDIDLESLLKSDEVIICNSLFGAWQVRQLADSSWRAGELAAHLRKRLEADDALVA